MGISRSLGIILLTVAVINTLKVALEIEGSD
jgi:hypothetical protein